MSMRVSLRSGRNGWVLLIAGVAAWDLLIDDTLSEAFSRAVHNRRTAPALTVTWAVLTAHLFDILPENVDPFHVFLKAFKRIPPIPVRVVAA